MTIPNGPAGDTAAGDPLPEAMTLVRGAADAGHQLKILGGLGVRVLCPDFPPRQRAGQDIDLACLGKSPAQGGRPSGGRRAASRTSGSTA